VNLSSDQRSILIYAIAAIAFATTVLAMAYAWLPAESVGGSGAMETADRLAYALKWDLLIFLWLAGCVRAVSSGRFRSPADIRGSAFGPPSPKIAVQVAVLQNSLEQTILAVGGHLVLATVLYGQELVLIPTLVALYLIGRIAFALGYAKGPAGRSFGMSLTGATVIAAFGIAITLLLSGR